MFAKRTGVIQDILHREIAPQRVVAAGNAPPFKPHAGVAPVVRLLGIRFEFNPRVPLIRQSLYERHIDPQRIGGEGAVTAVLIVGQNSCQWVARVRSRQ